MNNGFFLIDRSYRLSPSLRIVLRFVGERDEYTREHIEANDFPPNKVIIVLFLTVSRQ